jgi:3-dehydroquinate dehydratase-1
MRRIHPRTGGAAIDCGRGTALKNLRIGSKTVGKHPLIVGVVTSLAAMSRVLRRKIRPFDIIEVRLDLMKTGADKLAPFLRRMETAGTPVLLTIRSRREKGAWRGSEQERNDLYAALMPFVSAVDVEIRSPLFKALCKSAHRAGRVVIGSFHDFEGTPSLKVLKSMARLARAGGADIVKIATAVKKGEDADILFELLKDGGPLPLCVLGMSKKATDLRVRLACGGSCLTYGFVDRSAAPGQMACRHLARRLQACGVRHA